MFVRSQRAAFEDIVQVPAAAARFVVLCRFLKCCVLWVIGYGLQFMIDSV